MITGKAPPIGTKVIDFELPDESNTAVRFSDIRAGGPVLVLFYPSDFGMLCSIELGEVRDNYERFVEIGVKVIGISTNTYYSHAAWIANMKLPFTLLSDVDGKVAKAFGVLCPEDSWFKGRACRSVFLVSKEGVLVYVWVPEDTHQMPDLGRLIEECRKAVSGSE
ncbi:MAG: redoxin domain-containing protein [Euryarchaeota archaeon]|nr:redoxin domain-containing protein [Euryarchaeota archaeon]